jgi:DNA invertase Pin-like site-specific DNA recombinase
MSKRVALYLRVSTSEQTVENQQRELEAVAERHGWNVVAVFTDAGISGSKGRDKRPAYDRLCRGIARREFDQVSAWSVDRLGRSLQELVAFLGELHAKGVDLYLHQQGLDTATPAGKAMFQMMAVFAEVRARHYCRASQGWPLAGREPGQAARASPGERGRCRAHPGKARDRNRDLASSEGTRRRNRNGSQGEAINRGCCDLTRWVWEKGHPPIAEIDLTHRFPTL